MVKNIRSRPPATGCRCKSRNGWPGFVMTLGPEAVPELPRSELFSVWLLKDPASLRGGGGEKQGRPVQTMPQMQQASSHLPRTLEVGPLLAALLKENPPRPKQEASPSQAIQLANSTQLGRLCPACNAGSKDLQLEVVGS